jgi:thiamine biosynthesis protein ThiS
MSITVNGERRNLEGAATVAELMAQLQLVPSTLLVEHNGHALHRSEWQLRPIHDGDRIELVRVVAGG